MNLLSFFFLVFLSTSVLVRWWLTQRQLAYVDDHRTQVPDAFRERIPLAEHQKAADYTIVKARFGRLDMLAEAVILLAWTLGGGLDLLDRLWQGTGMSPFLAGVGVMLSVLVISTLIDLPFAAWRTFVIEERFGFNRTPPKLFVADQFKQLLLMLVLGAPLAAAVLWTLLNAGELWWLYAWLVWFGFSLALMWAYPVLIAPLFNRFENLDEDSVRSRIEGLLRRNGLTSNGIFVMDGSRRSGHGNAYFTGFGANKRIVFYDTLLEKLAADEVEAVLAHEIGHYKRKHIAKRMIVMAVLSLAGLALLGYLGNQDWFYHGLGVSRPSGHQALLLFMLAMPVFTFFLQPISAWLSRRHEFEADDFAAEQSDGDTLVRALVKLYAENASTLTPDPLYSAFHDSHPPAPVRVAHLSAARTS